MSLSVKLKQFHVAKSKGDKLAKLTFRALRRQGCTAIMTGSPVNIKDVSWTVALIHEPTQVLVCTAFLIELDWAITAARCLEKFGIFDVLYVLAGIGTMENKEAGDKAYVMYWHVHPCYVEKNSYDIALLKLSLKLNAAKASTIKLSGAPWPEAQMDNRKCDTVGWGSNMIDARKTDVLRKATIMTSHGDGCPCTMSFDQKRLVCSTGAALCNKDFGGALVCDGGVVAIAHQLVSSSCSDSPAADCRDLSVISSYVFICPFLNWIKQFVPSAPNKPASCFSPTLVSTRDSIVLLGTVTIVLDWF